MQMVTTELYCYVILNTVSYKSRDCLWDLLQEDNKFASTVTSGGHRLLLNLVMNYGTASTFGKDKTVFT